MGVLYGGTYEVFRTDVAFCDSDTKNQVESITEFSELEKNLDYTGLVPIKKLVSLATSIQDTTRHWPT